VEGLGASGGSISTKMNVCASAWLKYSRPQG
jgi:hypothetical protein